MTNLESPHKLYIPRHPEHTLLYQTMIEHFHVCVVDGVFEAVAGHAQADDVTDATASPPSVIYYLASEIDETAVAQARTTLHNRTLRAFVGRGPLQSFKAKEMLGSAVGV